MDKDLIACIDIGATKIAVALATRDGRFISLASLPMLLELKPHRILEEILNKVEVMLREADANAKIVAVGCPAPLDIARGLILSPPNLPNWVDFPLVEIIRQRLGALVILENDANAAALGEYRFGIGRRFNNFVYITVSTGIGGGVIVEGKLVHGVATRAGEVGHITVLPNGPRCGCGAFGCLNAISSGSAIAARARERLAAGESSILTAMVTGLENITAKTVADAVTLGDSFAKGVWNEAVYYLAIGIGNILVTLAPEAIILGGGVSASGELLLAPLRHLLERDIKILPVKTIHLLRAELGAESGLYGALALALDTLETGVH